jgi:beta-galactosidase
MMQPRRHWTMVLLVVSALEVGCGDHDHDGTRVPPTLARRTLSLHGTWDLGQGGLDDAPATFDRRVPVPGFVDLAEPPYANVGIPSNERDAFWYRYSFAVPEPHAACAKLRIHKALFGVKAWLNGEPIGDHLGAFTVAEFDATGAIRFDGDNTLLVGVGATKRQVPRTIPTGEDFEIFRWHPGIWDDVDLVLTGAQRILRVKVEPVIGTSEALIRTTVGNQGATVSDLEVEQSIREWASGCPASPTIVDHIRLDAHTETTVSQRVAVPDARLWSPDDPFLYVVRTVLRADGRTTDDLDTRFGMREVEWRSGAEKGFYLNGERVFLRGSNVALHRFFQDPQRGRLPWDPDWVRKLLSVHPRTLHWNSMRITLGRAPNLWYDITDEVGLLLADEFMMWSVWSLTQESKNWSVDEMEKEFVAWIQESWNHPSIAWWDAANETDRSQVTELIGRVRGLDPTRAWESGGFNPPQGPQDPVEDHPYLFKVIAGQSGDLKQLETNDGHAPQDDWTAIAPEHAYVLNEYEWLWL